MKPDYQAAANEMKGKAVLAAMDVNKPENSPVSRKYNITGFPTLLFFQGGELQYPYPGGNNKEVRKETTANEPTDIFHISLSTEYL